MALYRPVRITALIISFQHGAFVEDAIRSVLGQTRAADEIILVDDGSTDGTPALAKRIGGDAIQVIARDHRGITHLASTYNAGLEAASGDLVSVLEADDRWLPDKLAAHAAAMADPTVVLAHGPYAVIGSRGTRLRDRVDPIAMPEGPHKPLGSLLLSSYVMPVTTTFRRSALQEVGGFQQLGSTPHIDYPTALALGRRGRFFNSARVLAEWRKHARSGTTTLAGIDLDGADLCRALALQVRRSSAEPGLPTPSAIEQSWRIAQGRQIWNASRLLLKQRRYDDARALLRRSRPRDYPIGLTIRLAAAGLAARLRTDVEALARVTRGTSVFDELE